MARWSSQTTHNDISDFSDNPHLKRELKIWRLKIAAILLTVLAVIGISIKPAYRIFRENRINRNLEAAKEAARLEDWGTARDRARSVLLAREGDFEAYRIWTRALGKMGEPRTYMAAAMLFSDRRATDADKLECLQVMALQAPQAVALSAYASLPEEFRDHADYRAAITPLLLLRGETDVALGRLREVMGTRPSPRVKLELLKILCSKPSPENVREARQIFADLVKADSSEEALEALAVLGETSGALAPGAPLPDLPAWVAGQPRAQTLHHLLVLHPAIEAGAGDSLFQEAIDRFLATDPGVLGTWLTRHGQAARVVALLEEPAKTRADAYLARLHALLREGRENDLAEALKSPPESADMVEIEIVRAVMAGRGKDKAAAGAAWTRALNHAAFDTTRNRFIEIAGIAELHGAPDAADDAWVAAIRAGWGRLPLFDDLQPVFHRLALKGRSEDLLAVYRSLSRFEPANPVLLNNVAYLGFIHGVIPPAEAASLLERLLGEHPRMPEVASALMLAEIAAGRTTEALQRLPGVKEAKRVPPVMKLALEGVVLVRSGDVVAGSALLDRVPWGAFMRQERILFRDLLVKSQAENVPLPEIGVLSADEIPLESQAWRKAIESFEKDRASEILPALPAPRLLRAAEDLD